MTKNYNLLIKNAVIVTIDSEMRVINNGWLTIDCGKISGIGTMQELEAEKIEANQIIDAHNKVILPGFINTHTHIPMAYFKGIADDLPLDVWLTNYIWPLEKRMVNSEFVYHSALHGIGELIRNGTTTFNDMYFEGLFTAKAVEETGIRAVIGEGILDFPVANHQNAKDSLAYTLQMHEKYKDNELIDIAVSPHAIYTCCPETLKAALDLALREEMLLHIHLAETEKEYKDSLTNSGKTPTEYLDDLGLLSERVVAAHSVWLSDRDIDILAKRKVNIALNTESNLKLSSGFIPLKKCFQAGINITQATDGVASNNNLSIIEEMSTTAKLHKALNNDPTFLPAKEILKFSTINGAKALGKANEIGSLEIGKRADLQMLELNSLETLPMYDIYSQIVYNLNSGNISDVIINGKQIMRNRELLTVDERELIERANYYKEKMTE